MKIYNLQIADLKYDKFTLVRILNGHLSNVKDMGLF